MMTNPLACPLTSAVLWLAPYADVGAVECTVWPHAYLRCAACGERLYEGVSTRHARLFLCNGPCGRILDKRRVA